MALGNLGLQMVHNCVHVHSLIFIYRRHSEAEVSVSRRQYRFWLDQAKQVLSEEVGILPRKFFVVCKVTIIKVQLCSNQC